MENIESNKNQELLVSIRCLVYNHESFIRQCLDGFVMQKTNFRFEAIVHDDASTDGTAAIIREYAEKYPDIIKPIFEKENQYSKHDGSLRRIINSHMRGKYVAMCEGDDYWTDCHKLQKQVDFLESHPDYAMCSHLCQIFKQDEGKLGILYPGNITENLTYDLESYIKREVWLTQTLTVVYRKTAYKEEVYKQYVNSKDLTLYYHLLKSGKGYFINENMAVYRNHAGGVWTKATHIEKNISDFKTYIGIYNVEKDDIAAKALYIRLKEIGYVGISLLKKDLNLYLKVIRIINHQLGFLYAIKSLIRSLNFFHVFACGKK